MSTVVAERPISVDVDTVHSDDAWFSRFYAESFDSVYRYACMLTREDELAADVTAEVFVRAWIHRGTLIPSQHPVAWLLTVTRNRVMDEFRARRITLKLDDIDEPEDASQGEPDVELSAAQKAFIRTSIERLTPEQQHVVFLRFYEQLPHEKVAQQLGRTPNAVRAIQFRALARLRTLLESANVH